LRLFFGASRRYRDPGVVHALDLSLEGARVGDLPADEGKLVAIPRCEDQPMGPVVHPEIELLGRSPRLSLHSQDIGG
jgi:hypothetical protein